VTSIRNKSALRDVVWNKQAYICEVTKGVFFIFSYLGYLMKKRSGDKGSLDKGSLDKGSLDKGYGQPVGRALRE
jgi:hypothetical protein